MSKPLSLAEMQRRQRAAGITAPRADDESAKIRCDGEHGAPACMDLGCWHRKGFGLPESKDDETVYIENRQPGWREENDLVKTPPTPRTTILMAGFNGFCRLLPPTIQTMKDLTPEWIAENWDKPSPWCRMAGQPDHPEFEKNLAAFEAQ